MIHVTCRLTAKNRDQLQNPMLGNRVWATFFGVAIINTVLQTESKDTFGNILENFSRPEPFLSTNQQRSVLKVNSHRFISSINSNNLCSASQPVCPKVDTQRDKRVAIKLR